MDEVIEAYIVQYGLDDEEVPMVAMTKAIRILHELRDQKRRSSQDPARIKRMGPLKKRITHVKTMKIEHAGWLQLLEFFDRSLAQIGGEDGMGNRVVSRR